ncbi:MAG: FtsX-like permease family protein, partial [Candidatus Bathyarchaeia archaeon]
ASQVLSGTDPKRYEKCWSILREALGKASDVLALINYYIIWASANAVYLPAFFAVYSVIFAFFLFEDNRKKYISSLGLYGIFLMLLYVVYPGIRIVVAQNVNLFAAAAGASIAITLGIVYLLTSRWKLGMEGVVSLRDILTTLFSVGKRQIKIKKARSLLTLTSLVFLVLAFTALTSFGWVYGVTSAKISHTTAVTGYLMKKSGNQTFVQGQTNHLLFMPMDIGYYNRLSQMVSLVQAAPKIETYPTESPIAKVISKTGKMVDIRGVVGIDPINERIYTSIDTIVTPGSGTFLNTEDPSGLLISSSAASALKITAGEAVQFLTSEGVALNCTVKGIFSDTSYTQILDLDGQPFGPKTIIVNDGKPSIALCNATNVVFMNWQTAINLQRQINLQSQPRKEEDEIGRFNTISRIAFRMQSGYGTNEIVDIVVNNLYCDLYVADGSSVTRYYVGFYYEAKGAIEIVFPLAMSCLNIAAVMLNAVYERRKEMKILTVMGGNPGHIAMLFVSEAIILGMVGGGLGYLFGLGFYRVMAIFGSGVVVREKIEWWWSVLGLAFAVIASVLSTLRPALLAVKMYTPSKVRKIKATEEEKQTRKDEILKFYQARSITMPLKVNERDAIFFFNFLYDHLQALQSGLYERIKDLQEMPEMQTSKGRITKSYTFTYAAVSKGQKVEIKNEIRCSRDPNEDYYRVQLLSNLENLEVREEQIQRIAEIIRDICLDWAKSRSKIVG